MIIINRRINANRNIKNILEERVLSVAPNVGEYFYLMTVNLNHANDLNEQSKAKMKIPVAKYCTIRFHVFFCYHRKSLFESGAISLVVTSC